jgi:hypothetical protein
MSALRVVATGLCIGLSPNGTVLYVAETEPARSRIDFGIVSAKHGDR